jgi:hypothetical protein
MQGFAAQILAVRCLQAGESQPLSKHLSRKADFSLDFAGSRIY